VWIHGGGVDSSCIITHDMHVLIPLVVLTAVTNLGGETLQARLVG